jgi:CheY-like chemotaxis protein
LDITIAEDRVIPSVQCLDPETVVERNNTIVMDILMADFNGVMLVKKTQNDKRESPWQVTTTEMLRNLDRDNQKVNCEVMFELFKAKSIDRKIMWNQLRVQNKFTDVILQPSSGDPLPAHKAVIRLIVVIFS